MTPDLSSQVPLPTADGLPSLRSIGSVWRRFAAYVMDTIFLGVVGTGIGTEFFDKLSQLNLGGRLIGFCISLIYFTFFDSRLGNGQTFGKRLLKLQVIDAQGNTISFSKSFLRSVILVIPTLLYKLRFPEAQTPRIVFVIIFAVVLWIGGSTLYLIIFNCHTRQGLHDLAVGSYVANANEAGPVGATSIAKIHWVILGILLVSISVITKVASTTLEKKPPFPQMRHDAELIGQLGGVQNAHLHDMLLHSSTSGEARKVLFVSVTLQSPTPNQEAFADQVIRVLLQSDPNVQNYDQLTIRLFRGYDIGIASRWTHREFTHTPAEWEQRVRGRSQMEDRSPMH